MAHPRSRSASIIALGVFVLSLLHASSALAGDTDDIVLLKNGGRVRGVVVSEEPTVGVRIKLPGGAIRTLKPEEVDEVRYGGKSSRPADVPVAAVPPVAPSAPTAAPDVATYGKLGGGATTANPFGFGIGARVGFLISRFYLGLDYTHYFGETVVVAAAPTQMAATVSVGADAIALQLGYDLHVVEGRVPVVIRRYLTLGPAIAHDKVTLANGSSSSFGGEDIPILVGPGIYGRVMFSKIAFVATDAQFNFAVNESFSTEASFSAGAGVLLF